MGLFCGLDENPGIKSSGESSLDPPVTSAVAPIAAMPVSASSPPLANIDETLSKIRSSFEDKFEMFCNSSMPPSP